MGLLWDRLGNPDICKEGKELQEDVTIWFRGSANKTLSEYNKEALATLVFNRRFRSWGCPRCGDRVYHGYPDSIGESNQHLHDMSKRCGEPNPKGRLPLDQAELSIFSSYRDHVTAYLAKLCAGCKEQVEELTLYEILHCEESVENLDITSFTKAEADAYKEKISIEEATKRDLEDTPDEEIEAAAEMLDGEVAAIKDAKIVELAHDFVESVLSLRHQIGDFR